MSEKNRSQEFQGLSASLHRAVGSRKAMHFDANVGGAKRAKGTQTEEILNRVDPDLLLQAYFTEPTMHGGINIYKNCIKIMGYMATSKNSKVAGLIRKARKTRLDYACLDHGVRSLGTFGNSWIEPIWNRDGTHWVDFNPVDHRAMDFFKVIKDGREVIDVDKLNRVRSYEYKLDDGAPEIKFWRWDINKNPCIIHQSMNQPNPWEMGIGFIEPVYPDIELKENIEQARAQLAFKRAWPKVGVKYGDELNRPSAILKGKAEALAKLLMSDDTTRYERPYYLVPEYEPTPDLVDLTRDLEYSQQMQCGVMGLPYFLTTQSAVREPKHGSTLLIDFFEYNLRAMQQSTLLPEVLAKYIDLRGGDSSLMEFEWGYLSEKYAKEFSLMINRLTKTEFLPKTKNLQREVVKKIGLDPNVLETEDTRNEERI